MILLIDNYDSFTYNLLHYIGELGVDVAVHRNDKISVDEAINLNPDAIVISPGPCDPDKAGICLELVEQAAEKIPLLGVCLGHQCIAQVFGATIGLSPQPMHGKISAIRHHNTGLFEGLPTPFQATRYHSLSIKPDTMPDCLQVTANSDDDVIQGIQHKSLPVHGVQFHPESIASEYGHQMLRNFLDQLNIRTKPGITL